ncbi:tyrosine-protein phosphatase non-receptor type 9-like isoform X1 [Pollicipes pollicipes]|uniref:tyrosine-protein phosphatase non-receptor type 9-like isoform X1 n=2 Tax=Pollicipes pollicipes TaxID=41117 RepID=UPI0018852A10|nr:tyrosine-protein phosphatase non-receptor type 9-like isoform X1 [Pollicipes pollicipes]XP_037083079.1 tyrosine-protein phosphatase non-receptor type 9-like isoform X1 [Pollicipes pollicipes]
MKITQALEMKMASPLSNDEEVATQKFLELVNKARNRKGAGPITWKTAVKFLMARKFDVDRALTLYEQHERTRLMENLTDFHPHEDPLKSELEMKKFTLLPVRDSCGASIALFTARLHNPHLSTHKDTLQGIVYQLDVAMENIDAQRNGLVFIYDMSDSKYSNFDYDLSQKILNLLKGGYPARLKKVLIVTAPLWFRAPFKILRLFVREKLRDRVWTVSRPQLSLHIARESLPVQFGGTLHADHAQWLRECHMSMSNRTDGDLCDISLTQLDCERVGMTVDDVANANSSAEASGASEVSEASFSSDGDGNVRRAAATPPPAGSHSPEPAACSESSGFSDDDSLHMDDGRGATLQELLGQLEAKGRRQLYDDYWEIKAQAPAGTFNHSMVPANRGKNRYSDVLCYDHSRVTLSQVDDDPNSDYINANYVDGYKQKNAFISSQGPIPGTFADFWRMVWEQRVLLIVMTTRLVEQGRTKCGRYWPLELGHETRHGFFTIENLGVTQEDCYNVSQLLLTDTRSSQTRQVTHFLFTAWPDYNVPHSADAMLRFLAAVRQTQERRLAELSPSWSGHPLGPPILVHCSAGIGRTGTFCTLDICIRRLEDVGTVDVQGTVEKVRSQRAHSIQMPDQFVFCHTALADYAVSRGYLTAEEVAAVQLLAERSAADSD